LQDKSTTTIRNKQKKQQQQPENTDMDKAFMTNLAIVDDNIVYNLS